MTGIELVTSTFEEGKGIEDIDEKAPQVQMQPVTPTELTPATTPGEASPHAQDFIAMMGKENSGAEKQDDRIRELVKTLTLEEQVC
jgi:hypothetical protein